MLLGIWKGIGWNMVVFLAALQTVPTDLYEAASIDGGRRFFPKLKRIFNRNIMLIMLI